MLALCEQLWETKSHQRGYFTVYACFITVLSLLDLTRQLYSKSPISYRLLFLYKDKHARTNLLG